MTKSQPVFAQTPDGTVKFDLTIPSTTVNSTYDEVLRELARKAEIKGFRRGKAPLTLVKSQTKESDLLAHVLEHAFPPRYTSMVRSAQLVPLIEPRVTPKSLKLGTDWVLAVELATAPTFDLGAYEPALKKALKTIKSTDKADKRLNLVFDTLLAQIQFPISPLLVEEETKSALSRLANQLQSLKLTVTDYAKSLKKTPAELVKEYQQTAETNLRLEFILQKIVAQHNPPVTDAEITALKPPKGQEPYAKYVLQKRKVLDILQML